MIPSPSTKWIIPRKLIEVALPLEAINKASTREKSIRHGHPSTLHLWWARRPLATARAVLFAQMVNDPGWNSSSNKTDQQIEAERKELFALIEELVQWESTTNEKVLNRARAEIQKSWRETCEANKEHPEFKKAWLYPRRASRFSRPFLWRGNFTFRGPKVRFDFLRIGLKSCSCYDHQSHD